ncbi:TolC family protein [Pedobacter aquae]|uniref:TolC family protein n=1 Tax=Pedobacter aquae TaxID=2605747 RepID=A0A5C0VDC4_9SPHI|nr:TolC family protein [Pedobacter aquae]QEK50396.1 TolC family protein [Pedobacter aquae]
MKTRLMMLVLLLQVIVVKAQEKLDLTTILKEIEQQNPQLKMYDAEIKSMDEMAKGAKDWESPQLGTGLWMVPYNTSMWRRGMDGSTGMGQYAVSLEQMFPNKSNLNANAKLMETASSVELENKKGVAFNLFSLAKQNFVEWKLAKEKAKVLEQNQQLLSFMIRSTEIRYKNGLEKLNTYYKAKAALANVENMQLMLQNDIKQNRIMLNTLMNRNKLSNFDIDTVYPQKQYQSSLYDSTTLANHRSDIKAIEQSIVLNGLEQAVEKSMLKPEFGVRYEHMFGFGGMPMQYSLMGMIKIPVAWSTKSERANIEGLKWRSEALRQEKDMLLSEIRGRAFGKVNDLQTKEKQLKLFEQQIIPALRKNYQSLQLAYEQNTAELFMLFDAWESLNMTQLNYIDLQKEYLMMQIELDRILELR